MTLLAKIKAASVEAKRKFDSGEFPARMRRNGGMYEKFEVIVEEIFSAPDLS